MYLFLSFPPSILHQLNKSIIISLHTNIRLRCTAMLSNNIRSLHDGWLLLKPENLTQASPSSHKSLRLTCLLGKSLNKEQVLLPSDHPCCSPSPVYLTLMEPEHLHHNKEKDLSPRNDSFILFSQPSETCLLNTVLKYACQKTLTSYSFIQQILI